jgi:sugar transferase EpsL
VKRALDILVASTLLAVLSPLLLVIAMVVRLTSGSPAMFTQDRPGKGGKVFRLYKFRTMNDARDATGRLLPDEQRLSRAGRLLRATSMDELPEFWNVLKGDMSLVGPRPLRVQYLDHYTPTQAHRHDVRPGITGLAQVSGRNDLSWSRRLELDVWYVENSSFWLDVRILARTVRTVLHREGASSYPGQEDMPNFRALGHEEVSAEEESLRRRPRGPNEDWSR